MEGSKRAETNVGLNLGCPLLGLSLDRLLSHEGKCSDNRWEALCEAREEREGAEHSGGAHDRQSAFLLTPGFLLTSFLPLHSIPHPPPSAGGSLAHVRRLS